MLRIPRLSTVYDKPDRGYELWNVKSWHISAWTAWDCLARLSSGFKKGYWLSLQNVPLLLLLVTQKVYHHHTTITNTRQSGLIWCWTIMLTYQQSQSEAISRVVSMLWIFASIWWSVDLDNCLWQDESSSQYVSTDPMLTFSYCSVLTCRHTDTTVNKLLYS